MRKYLPLTLVLISACSHNTPVPVPVPAPRPAFGINVNVAGTCGNEGIPERNIMKVDWETQAKPCLDSLVSGSSIPVARFRSFIWFVGHNGAPSGTSGWSNFPLQDDEIEKFNTFLASIQQPFELGVGFLWQARVNDEGVPKELWLGPQVIVDAIKASFMKLKPPPNMRLDIDNEFEVLHDNQQPVMELWYPWALQWAHDHGIKATVSAIIGDDGNPVRVEAVYNWLRDHGGLPDYLDIHVYGFGNPNVPARLPGAVAKLKSEFNLPILLGESDILAIPGPWPSLTGIEEVLYWIP